MACEVVGVSVALDWTPNTNHVGFFVAKALGFYQEVGLLVDLISPHLDQYQTTPCTKVSTKAATFALGPSESVISYHLPPYNIDRVKLKAIATILQEDLSAIVTLKESEISRPKELDGRLYGSYGARFEGRIVQKLIQSDGGKGQFNETTPDKLCLWDALLSGQVDATWIFKGWEGIQAQLKGVELNEFVLSDFGIPYGLSPVIIAHPDFLKENPEIVRKFLSATAKGFFYSSSNIEQASNILTEMVMKENPTLTEALDPVLVRASLGFLSKYFHDSSGVWGTMPPARWSNFLSWLCDQGLLASLIQSRNPFLGVSASLDDLRGGNAGDALDLSNIQLPNLFTNKFLS